MSGIGHQGGRMRDQSIAEFHCDETEIEHDGEYERTIVVSRCAVMSMRVPVMRVPVVVMRMAIVVMM
jgi:hypothetical protein